MELSLPRSDGGFPYQGCHTPVDAGFKPLGLVVVFLCHRLVLCTSQLPDLGSRALLACPYVFVACLSVGLVEVGAGRLGSVIQPVSGGQLNTAPPWALAQDCLATHKLAVGGHLRRRGGQGGAMHAHRKSDFSPCPRGCPGSNLRLQRPRHCSTARRAARVGAVAGSRQAAARALGAPPPQSDSRPRCPPASVVTSYEL
jgi:hypothetical protein